MCGISGVFSPEPLDRTTLTAWVVAMSDAIRHRGPDDSGVWVDGSGSVGLSFRRLSIIDLSELGHQPMASASGRFTIVFNGEVYNYQTLKDELHRRGHGFRGHSDTEVILAAFEEWGVAASLPRLFGMFALAVWDGKERRLTLARDRLGKKPLYVARHGLGISFASELKAILAGPPVARALNAEATRLYLRRLYVPGPFSILEGACQLLPGHYVTVSDPAAKLEPRAYWSVDAAASAGLHTPFPGTVEEAATALEAHLRDAVSLRMYADVPVGALLSGGIDSSLVVAIMQSIAREPVHTYSVGFDRQEHDESAHAAAVAAHLGTQHRQIRMDSQALLELMPHAARLFDEPHANPSQVPTYLVSKLAREEVTVALTGDGGDEIFGGYNRYLEGARLIPRALGVPLAGRALASRVMGQVSSGVWDRVEGILGGPRLLADKVAKLAALLPERTEFGMYDALLSTPPEARALVRTAAPMSPAGISEGSGLGLVERMMLQDQREYLPGDLLAKVDRASMAASLEVRTPFLDHRVVEFAWTLPPECRIHSGRGKWILRRLLESRLPPHLRERPKVGFSVPLAAWLGGPLRPWAEGLLRSGRLSSSGVIDGRVAERMWMRFLGGQRHFATSIWALLVLIAWCEEHGVQM